MTTNRTVSFRVGAVIVGAAVLLALGATGMYMFLRSRPNTPPSDRIAVAPPPATAKDIAVTLSQEAIARAGIKTAKPVRGQIGTAMSVPGIVEPDAYRQVVVRSVAPGQVRSVSAILGAHVKRGAVLATIHTPELAEAVRMYLSMRSEFDVAHQRVGRLEPLVKIGAASQQELETAKAEHTRHATDVESARSKLILLGMTAGQASSLTESSTIDSTVRITAPWDGVISARAINPGTNVDASMDLFTIIDLTSVWIVANVYQQDLSRVQVGTTATVTTAGVNGRTWSGRVGYIDPQLSAETRAAKLRIEVNNPANLLRLGMYVDVALAGASSVSALLILRSALQTIGSQTVVYVRDQSQPGRFREQSVAVRSAANEQVEVLSGVDERDDVVVEGSFALRAERERVGLPAPVVVSVPVATPQPALASASQAIEIAITKEGFVPSTVNVKADLPIDLAFVRKTEDTCAKEVVVPSVNARQALPLNQQVVIRLAPAKAGTLAFTCGMNMLKGTLVVR
jgi:cobalt-zinc-cadmium efflux system membrane fusion protein